MLPFTLILPVMNAICGLSWPFTILIQSSSVAVIVTDGESSVPGAWDEIRVPFADSARLVDELCWYGPDVQVLGPSDVRSGVIERLRAVSSSGERDQSASSGEASP